VPITPAERYLGLTEKILEAANGIAKDLINRSRKPSYRNHTTLEHHFE
jgi:hypothetical protein